MQVDIWQKRAAPLCLNGMHSSFPCWHLMESRGHECLPIVFSAFPECPVHKPWREGEGIWLGAQWEMFPGSQLGAAARQELDASKWVALYCKAGLSISHCIDQC